MRAALAFLLAACSVPDKEPTTIDGGTDAPIGGPLETTITEAPAELSTLTAATFRFEANDPAATFECALDGETPAACTSPHTRTLGDGSHGFVVRAVRDGEGDPTPAEHVWTIDTIAPDTRLVATPPAADNSVTVRFEFDSLEDNVTFECALDGNSFTECESGDKFGPITDGTHSFAVRARDRAGNVDTSPSIYAWVVDTSTPDTQLIDGPEGATAQTSATFTFVSPDAGSGATFQCSIDGSGFTACSSPRTFANLGAGAHTFAVRVRDAVGNFDPTPATRTWTVDTVPPQTMITSGPTGAVAAASATFVFTSNEQDATFTCRIDGGAFAPCTSPHNLLGLAQGAHTFAVRATDAAGHTDTTAATRTWTVDTLAPEVEITVGPSEGGISGPRVTFELVVSEGQPECSLDDAPFTACASPLRFNAPAGAHQLRIRASDQAGNATTVSRAWTIECAAPGPAGAAGVLHLDEADQTLANATGGAAAVLGLDVTVEPSDPQSLPGRFGNALGFEILAGDVVTWPVGLPATNELAIELWVRPESVAGQREIFATADDRVALRATAVSPTMVQLSMTIGETGGPGQQRTVTSAAVAAGQWHHVVVSLQEPMLWMWVDGVRTQLANVRPGTPLAFDGIRLGGAGTFAGALDEVWLAQTPIVTDEAALTRYCPL
jgi:hypothetical protein